MADYILKVKNIVDNLIAAASLVSDSNIVSTLLSDLPFEYESFVTSVNTRVDPVSFEQLIGLMFNHNFFQEKTSLTSPPASSAIEVNMPSKNKSSSQYKEFHRNNNGHQGRGHAHGRGHGHGRNTYSNYTGYFNNHRSHIICQVCNRAGHLASNCYHQYKRSYQSYNVSPTAMFHAPSSIYDQNWYLNSGGTHHITADMVNLITHSDYAKTYQI